MLKVVHRYTRESWESVRHLFWTCPLQNRCLIASLVYLCSISSKDNPMVNFILAVLKKGGISTYLSTTMPTVGEHPFLFLACKRN